MSQTLSRLTIAINGRERQEWSKKAKIFGIPVTVMIRNYMNALVAGKIKPPPFVDRPQDEPVS